jgi:chromosome segregation ATPase
LLCHDLHELASIDQ